MKEKTAGPVRATEIPCCAGRRGQKGRKAGKRKTNGDDGVIDLVSLVLVATLGVVQSRDGVTQSVAEMDTVVGGRLASEIGAEVKE